MKKLSVSITILFLLVFGLFLNTAVASAQKAAPIPNFSDEGAAVSRSGLPSWEEVVNGPAGVESAEAAEVTAVAQTVCARTITANVVALDQSFFYNRMGAANPAGLIYALRRDVINKNNGLSEAEGGVLTPGQVSLRSDKRPRPLTLRMNVGDCLQINFQNLLDPVRVNLDQPATRAVSIYVNGLQPVNSVADSGAYVGLNAVSGVAAPGEATTYTLYAAREGTYLLHNKAAVTGSEGNAGTASYGLFGAVNVEPAGAEWYRSQVTRDEMSLAATGSNNSLPVVDYDAVYPAGHRFAGLPILKMLDDNNEIVHSDLNAIITGPSHGDFSAGTFANNPLYPDREKPFREFTVIFHDEIAAVQAFDLFADPMFESTLHSVRDGFAINYGTGGIGAEIIASRLGVGPMWNCTGCKYEEFFLSSWAVSDPAMIVDVPANADLDGDGQPDPGAKATKALYPDDPSNVYHSYLNDNTRIRNLSVGKEAHIFHLHAHQWLNSPDDPNSTYLDSQALGPGAAFTYEIPYGGSGNRNKTAGDSIFHCHFYPHFAQGMWSLWRVHDTFEAGTPLDADGRPLPGSRALPDGEIAAGTPYAEPCRDDSGNLVGAGNIREYKAAVFQMDVVINKAGWHAPQQRILALWEDVGPTLSGERPPQPLVMRLNVNDCANYYHTNLVPGVYELDDFQVRTPTDIIGQHIHLVKFDVTSSDGSANGFNYEDGTFSPDEVRERINAIRLNNGCIGDAVSGGDPRDGAAECPLAEAHPFFGAGPDGRWLGARTTVQRWFADPLLNSAWDKGLGTIFTHDHFSPSTHQQVGLYGTVLVEPEGSDWQDPETGEPYGTRASDGGPTSWQANIITQDVVNSFREFYLESSDFVMAYEAGRGVDASGSPIPDFTGAINPPFRDAPPAALDGSIFYFPPFCANGQPRPCAEAIAADDPGTYVVNYRNEPVGMRVFDPNAGAHSHGTAGDPAYAFSSRVNRADPALNAQPNFYPPLTDGVGPRDPYTPLLRAYQGDNVRLRVQVGGQEEEHSVSVHGVKWLWEPRVANSGWRNAQFMGISEYANLDFQIPVIPFWRSVADYLYTMGTQVEDYWNGTWGIMRSYGRLRRDLQPLPNNPVKNTGIPLVNARSFSGICPKDAPIRRFDITAVAAQDVLPDGALVYNSRPENGGPLHDPTALMYVFTSDLDRRTGMLKEGVPLEPLILRANAGDCIKVMLRNKIPAQAPDLNGNNALPPIIHKAVVDGGVVTFNANDLQPSSNVGIHPQLLAYDVRKGDGANVGLNRTQTVSPPPNRRAKQYTWYAGDVSWEWSADGQSVTMIATPIEFGAVSLMPADKIQHASKGLIGALVVEPQGAAWTEDPGTRASVTVTKADGSTFREFVAVLQNDVNMRFGDGSPVGNIAGEGAGAPEDPQDTGQKAINYRTEPLWFRLGIAPDTAFLTIGEETVDDIYSNEMTAGTDPQTPVFTAVAGTPVRFHVVEPGGHARVHVFTIQGHGWERQPYTNNSTEIGHNPTSPYTGSQEGVNPGGHFTFNLESAGGAFAVPGDYYYGDMASFGNYQGLWGIFRVLPAE